MNIVRSNCALRNQSDRKEKSSSIALGVPILRMLWATYILTAFAPAQAQPVTVVNASFESPSFASSCHWDYSIDNWTHSAQTTGRYRPCSGDFLGGIPDGQQVAWAHQGTISQILEARLQAQTAYQLVVDVGHLRGHAFGGYRVQLWAGGVLLAEDDSSETPPERNWATSHVTFDSDCGVLIGQQMEIRLVSLGDETDFDNVRLWKTTYGPLADVDCDCDVDLQDLTVLLSHFGTPGGASRADGDLTGDGDVDLADLAEMLAGFGTTCP